ncbi:MAG TPA: biotin carboxylase N-terminal domain-containing protein [Pseudonocardiaceae bacterium]|nr:biotin carboxylase N-terminal domain-containing protein [Pseudonocardiaceae bacterium]
MIESLLVANRGEIARRIIRTARATGVRTVAVYSSVDSELPFVREADKAVPLAGPPPAVYRDAEQILSIAADIGAAAIHPGYGFLSENPEFARRVTASGLIWVGPPAAAIEAMGDKVAARARMAVAEVPVAPGSAEAVTRADACAAEAARVGYPVMIKASAGGGGMGMAVVESPDQLVTEFERVTGFAGRLFGDDRVFVERYFPRVRHVEVQVLGLASGQVVALGERDCSVQRRNQKVVEETPSPAVDDTLRERMCQAAVRAAQAVGYRNAGTVEFLLDPASGEFFFLEMNTRLQVEHPITEAVYGVDLVAEQLRVAAGLPPGIDLDAVRRNGHAIELRINAEDPKRFLPRPGTIENWVEPTGEGVRVDAGYAAGDTVTPAYDSLLAKLVVHGADREQALARARAAVAGFQITGPERGGVKTNLPFLAEVLDSAEFVSGDYDTGIVGRLR